MDYSKTETRRNLELLKQFKEWSKTSKSRNQILDKRINIAIIVISACCITGLILAGIALFN